MNERLKKRCFTVLTALALGVGVYFITTSETIVGRRCAKLAVYYWNPQYWPVCSSVFLWLAAVGFASYVLVRRSALYALASRCFQKGVDVVTRANANRSRRFGAAALGAVLLVGGALYYFDRLVPCWRFLRYKVYGEFFQDPVETLLESGRFSIKLCVGPLVGLGVLAAFYLCKRSGKRNLLVLLTILLGLNGGLRAEDRLPDGAASGAISLVRAAEYKISGNIQEIASRPSKKELDGGFNADESVLQCFAETSYRYTGGRYENENILFRMRFPSKVEAGKKYPLLIWLHGYAESVGDNKRHLAHLQHAIKSFYGPDAPDFYAIALQCPPDNQNWQATLEFKNGKGDSPLEILSEITDAAIKEFPIDERRISVIGISTGATAAWNFVKRRSGQIAGLVSFSGTPNAGLIPNDFKNTALWAFNNKRDVNASWQRTSDFIDKVNALGGDGYITLQDHGLHDSWTEPLQKQNVVEWCISQSLDGKGRVQNADYPKRSGVQVFLMFYLPGAVLLLSAVFGASQRRKDEV